MRYSHVVVGGGIAGVCCAMELARCLGPQQQLLQQEQQQEASAEREGQGSGRSGSGASSGGGGGGQVLLLSSSAVLKGVREVARLGRMMEELQVVEMPLSDLAAGGGGALHVMQGVATALDTGARVLHLDGGGSVQYDNLCLCTGARPKELAVSGADNPAVLTLRDTDSVLDLAQRLRSCRRLMLVGNGGIALELVGALTQHAANAGDAAGCDASARNCQQPAGSWQRAHDGGLPAPELVWCCKHAHIGDAFFDHDASDFLLRSIGGSAGGLYSSGSPPPGCPPSAVPSSDATALQHAAADAAAAAAAGGHDRGHSSSSSGGGGGGAAGARQPRGHAAGPCWTRDLLQRSALGTPSEAPTSSRTASAADGGTREAEAAGSDRAEAYCSSRSGPVDGIARGGGSGFRLVLEAGATVARVDAGGPGHARGGGGAGSAGGGAAWPAWVTLDNGKSVGADVVVCGLGVVPCTEWLPPQLRRAADGGLAVGRDMRTTDPHVFAAGDCCTAEWPDMAPHWFQMRLWTQARVMGVYAAHCMLGIADDLASGFNFELFTHVTRFVGKKVVLLGLYNGQRLEGEPTADVRMYSRTAPAEDGSGDTFVRVLLLRGRMQGAVLLGNTELEEAFENLILDGLDVSVYGAHILDPDFELEHVFD